MLHSIRYVSMGKRAADHVAISRPAMEMGTRWRVCLRWLDHCRSLASSIPINSSVIWTLSIDPDTEKLSCGPQMESRPSWVDPTLTLVANLD